MMPGSDAPTHDELSAMKVDELRNICGELGLMAVSYTHLTLPTIVDV